MSEDMIEKKKYQVVYKALKMACDELENSNTENTEVVDYKLNGSLMGMFLMKAEREVYNQRRDD